MAEQSGPLVLGVDLGGTKILTAVVSAHGEILSRDHSVTPAAEGAPAIVQAILESAERALEQAGIQKSALQAIGIGAPGISNPDTGVLFTSPNLPGIRDFAIRDAIAAELGTSTFVINDANAAALGEYHFGAGRGARHFVYITVSTGIGGGIIIDGEIYSGATGIAGEVGHMTIDDNGPPCHCGNRGCWETLASGTALAREARRRITEGASTSIPDYVEGNVDKVTAREIHAAAEQGDGLAKELIRQTGYYLGVGLANLINIFNPELIIIGGGLSNIGDMLLAPAIKTAGERSFRKAFEAVRLVPAELGGNSGVLGAAAYAIRKMGKGNRQPGEGHPTGTELETSE